MALKIACQASCSFLKIPHFGLLVPSLQSNVNIEIVRHARNKHWNPKFKRLRKEKVIKVDLPNFNEKNENLSDEQIRSKMKEHGIKPGRPWNERPFYIASTGGIFEPYVPPEGDGKLSMVTPGGAKQSLQFLEKKSKSMMAIRKVKSFEEDFDVSEFLQKAQDIYIRAHQHMAAKEFIKMEDLVTEQVYPEMMHNTKLKTIRWKFLKSLEPPRLVHARCTNVITKENMFGQLTIRFHTQQQLTIYDRFGRLIYGSEILPKDVLEYVVFEKHLSNLYGNWRLHDKIIPDWMPPREPAKTTYVKEQFKFDVAIETDEIKPDKTTDTVAETKESTESKSDLPKVAAA